MIAYIWAQDDKGAIGKNNQLPWRLPADLKFFKETTIGHPIVMGRKTFESIGKPLPGRTNIILTRNKNYTQENCLIFHDKASLLQWIHEKNQTVFITGGSDLFSLFKEQVQTLYVTKIKGDFHGDTFFPTLDWNDFDVTNKRDGETNEKNPYEYTFYTYQRNRLIH